MLKKGTIIQVNFSLFNLLEQKLIKAEQRCRDFNVDEFERLKEYTNQCQDIITNLEQKISSLNDQKIFLEQD